MGSVERALFDRGYPTVTPDLHLEVSGRIRGDWDNGRHPLLAARLPGPCTPPAGPDLLRWHDEEVFRASARVTLRLPGPASRLTSDLRERGERS